MKESMRVMSERPLNAETPKALFEILDNRKQGVLCQKPGGNPGEID